MRKTTDSGMANRHPSPSGVQGAYLQPEDTCGGLLDPVPASATVHASATVPASATVSASEAVRPRPDLRPLADLAVSAGDAPPLMREFLVRYGLSRSLRSSETQWIEFMTERMATAPLLPQDSTDAPPRQPPRLVTVGVDMGGSLYAVCVRDRSTEKVSHHRFRDRAPEGTRGARRKEKVRLSGWSGGLVTKEDLTVGKIRELAASGAIVTVRYEAGRYGYTLARRIMDAGAFPVVVPIGQLTLKCRGKVIKTDRLDAQLLAELDPGTPFPYLQIPTLTEEERRSLCRALAGFDRKIASENDAMIAILEMRDLRFEKRHRSASQWRAELPRLSGQSGWRELGDTLPALLECALERLELLERQRKDWQRRVAERQRTDAALSPEADVTDTVFRKLSQFTGLGPVICRTMAWELGDFRRFRNGKEFSAYLGLTPCASESGTCRRDQGISKQGRKELRRLAVEAAWLWVQYQGNSWLARKWAPRLAVRGKSRRTAIVALARQLMVALWRLVVRGEPIAGATVNREAA